MKEKYSYAFSKYVLRRVDVYVCQKVMETKYRVVCKMWLVFHANAYVLLSQAMAPTSPTL